MSGFLLDTNVLSELRKGDRCHPCVAAWFAERTDDELFVSALTLGEIERGILLIERRDPVQARQLRSWLSTLTEHWSSRILAVDADVAAWWARVMTPDPVPVLDALIAATALRHDLTLVTRNTADVAGSGARLVNPFVA